MSDQKTAYPLSWPEGWPRTDRNARRHSKFGGSYGPTMAKGCEFLQLELDRLKAVDPILSTNIKQNLRGIPISGAAQPLDAGAAVYFKLKGRTVSLACDKWNRVECNVWAIAKHIESLRGQDRWGVGSIEQAFRGYMALPAVGQSSGDRPWEVLGVPLNASEEQMLAAYRILAKKLHPDNPETGNVERFNRLKAAYDLMKQNLKPKAA